MVQNLPCRIMTFVLLFSAETEGPTNIFLIVVVCVHIRMREKREKGEERTREVG